MSNVETHKVYYKWIIFSSSPLPIQLLAIQSMQTPCVWQSTAELHQVTFQSLAPSESSFCVFLCSFFSFFLRFRSALSSAVSPSCLFRFFDVPWSSGGDACDSFAASAVDPACACSSIAAAGASICLGG